jgi:hypothetical protein
VVDVDEHLRCDIRCAAARVQPVLDQFMSSRRGGHLRLGGGEELLGNESLCTCTDCSAKTQSKCASATLSLIQFVANSASERPQAQEPAKTNSAFLSSRLSTG